MQFTLKKKKKDNLSYIRRLAAGSTTLGGRHFMKEGVYFPHRDCVGMSFESKKKKKECSLCPPLPAPVGFRDSLAVPGPSLQ